MERFGIFSPLYVRKDMPYALLSESLMPDARNIRIEDGVIIRQQGRGREMYGTYGTTQFDITAPSTVHAVNSITSGTKTITISGDHHAEFLAGNIICVSDTAGQVSDGHYSIASNATYGSGVTSIVVTESITTGGAVGNVLSGAATIIKFYTQVGGLTGDTEFLFAFTANHAFLWDSLKRVWKLRHTTASAVTYWSVVSFNELMVLCNWGSSGAVDKIMKWDPIASPYTVVSTDQSDKEIVVDGDHTSDLVAGIKIELSGTTDNDGSYTIASSSLVGGDTVIVVTETMPGSDWSGANAVVYLRSFLAVQSSSGLDLDTGLNYIVGAKFLYVFENHLWLGYVKINSSTYPRANYWSDIGDVDSDTAWNSGDAGGWNGELNPSTAILPGSDFQSGFGEIEGSLIIFKEKSIHQVWIVTTDDVWNAQKISHVIGTSSPDSIVRDANGNLYFLASDMTFREIRLGNVSEPLAPMVRQLEPSLLSGVRSTFIGSLQEVWWAVPAMIGRTSPTANNALFQYSIKDSSWQVSDIAVSAFGAYIRQTAYTWDTLPYPTWEDWGGTWDDPYESAGHVIDLVSDYSGYAWAAHVSGNDAGSAFSAYFELGTDFANGSAAGLYKVLLEMRFLLEALGSTETATISISVDGGDYATIGTVPLYGNGLQLRDLPCDVRGRRFRIKFTAANPFRFLGCIFGYEFDGEY